MLFRYFDRLLKACAVLAAALFGAIAVAITLNVVLRNLGLPVVYGTLDAVEYGLLIATFLGAPWVLSLNAHVQVDLVTAALPSPVRRSLARVISLLAVGLCLCFAWFGFQAMLTSMARGSMIRTAFVIPEWWTLMVVPLSLLLCAIEFLRQAISPTVAPRQAAGL